MSEKGQNIVVGILCFLYLGWILWSKYGDYFTLERPKEVFKSQIAETNEPPKMVEKAYEILAERRMGNDIFRIITLYNLDPNGVAYPTKITQVFYLDKAADALIIKKPLLPGSNGFPPNQRSTLDVELKGRYMKKGGNTYFVLEDRIFEFTVTRVNVYVGQPELYDEMRLLDSYSVRSTMKAQSYELHFMHKLKETGGLIVNYLPIDDVDPY